MKNSGKKLEELIKLAAEEQGIDYTRLKDAGWQGEKTERRFTSKNICDCILFRTPFLFFVEAKSRKTSLRFDEITQLDDLIKKHNPKDKVFSGVICQLKGRMFWIVCTTIIQMRKTIGKKSFNLNDAEHFGIELKMVIPKGKRKARPDLFFI